MTNVIDSCYVTTPQATKSKNYKAKNNKKWGTRVFRYNAENYCDPYFEHDDEQWAVFICFKDGGSSYLVEEVKKILMEHPGDKNIFIKNPRLAELGGFYSLNVFEKFGELIDKFEAMYYNDIKLSRLHRAKLNGIEWRPSAEVLSAMAVIGSSVYPTGTLVTVDNPANYPNRIPKIGLPNVAETNPDLLEKIKNEEQPPYGVWIDMTAHIHPYGDMINPINNASDCPQKKGDIFTAVWKQTGKIHQFPYSSGASTSDLLTQNMLEEKNDNKRYRSVIVDRHFIWLYSCIEPSTSLFKAKWGKAEMAIKRKSPNNTNYPK